MKNVICAELYKLRHDKLLWIVLALYSVVGFYTGFYGHAIINVYKGLELFILPEIAYAFFSFTVAAVTGYIISSDFSRRTIQNALSVGVNKKSCYFSRLLVQGMLTGVLFLGTGLIHIICHSIWPQGNTDVQITLLWQKLFTYMAVILLQLWAYASVMNAVCYFLKNQLVTVVFAIGLVYFEMIIQQAAEISGMIQLQSLCDFLPTNVIKNIFVYAVYDRVFTGEFFRYALSAILIIAVSSGVGYMRFYYDRG